MNMPATKSDPDFLILLAASIAIFLLFITAIISLVFLSQKLYQSHVREKEKLQETYRQEVLQAQVEMQEQTFSIISEEIHDSVGQALSLAKLNLNIGQPKQIDQAKEILTSSIQELRSIARNLNSTILRSKSLVSFIREATGRLEQTQAYQIDVQLTYDDEGAIYKNQVLLVRIFQEAISNIIKHSSATMIEISATICAQGFILKIKDNGAGFELGATQSGIGLSSMQKRAILAGGKLEIISKPGEGCLLVLNAALTKLDFDEQADDDGSISRRS